MDMLSMRPANGRVSSAGSTRSKQTFSIFGMAGAPVPWGCARGVADASVDPRGVLIHRQRRHANASAMPAEAAGRIASGCLGRCFRSEEHTSELQSLMRNSYAVFCWKKKKYQHRSTHN